MRCDHGATGRLIVLEGIEGAGKTTQIDTIVDMLRARGIAALATREPGGTALGEAIRAVLMREYETPMPAMSELLLMFAARAAHLAEVIEPALARGEWVVCDRFTDASYAYQGAGRALGAPAVATLERLVQGQRRPDCVLLFDLAVTAGLARVGERAQANRFDRETLDFHERVRSAYRKRAAHDPARYRVIDAARPAAAVRAQLQSMVSQWL